MEAAAAEVAVRLDLDEYAAAVVMSHHLDSDLQYLRALASSQVPYVGLLGPAARRERLLGDLGELGDLAPALRARLRAPVGLDIGGRTPESIALAIVGDIHAALTAAPAGPSARPPVTGGGLNELLPLLAVLAVSGVLAGFVAGMLGVGGGIVTVPVLEYSLRFAGVPEEYPHARGRGRRRSPPSFPPRSVRRDAPFERRGRLAAGEELGAAVVIGAAAGSLLASHAPPPVLASGVRQRGAADRGQDAAATRSPARRQRRAAAAPAARAGGVIGGISAMMGIGGGTLTVPTLNLCGYPIHRAVGTAAFFGIFISIPAPWAMYWHGRRWNCRGPRWDS